jgi:hypothetical protein
VIVTVTLNPSLDQTLEVDTLVRGGINKTEHLRRDPGGKGVNVARALSTNGVPAVAVFPAGGLIGDALVSLLVGQRVDVEVVRIGGMTRRPRSTAPGSRSTPAGPPCARRSPTAPTWSSRTPASSPRPSATSCAPWAT